MTASRGEACTPRLAPTNAFLLTDSTRPSAAMDEQGYDMTWQPPCSATGRGASGFSFVLRFITERSYDLAFSSFQHAVRGSLARTGVRPVHPRRCRLPQMLPGRRHSCNSSYQNRLDSFERSCRSTKDDASCLIKHHVIGSAMWVPKAGCCSLSRLRV